MARWVLTDGNGEAAWYPNLVGIRVPGVISTRGSISKHTLAGI